MRTATTCLLFYALAASAFTAERPSLSFLDGLDNAQWPPERPTRSPHPLALHGGTDLLYGKSTYTLNDTETEISSRLGTRIHGEAILTIPEVAEDVGIGFGLGISRSRWVLADHADIHTLCGNAIASAIIPLSANGRTRCEIQADIGYGQAGVNDIIHGAYHEIGIQTALIVPLGRSTGWEFGCSFGGYYAAVASGKTTVSNAGVDSSVDMDFRSFGLMGGLVLGWRQR